MDRKETIVRAILELHYQRHLRAYPSDADIEEGAIRAHVNTYRPYAEEEADAMLKAVGDEKPPMTPRDMIGPVFVQACVDFRREQVAGNEFAKLYLAVANSLELAYPFEVAKVKP